MKKRSIIKVENFLLTSGATAGAAFWAFLSSWVVVPVRSVRDARSAAKKLDCKFDDVFPDAYASNVYRLAQKPFAAYYNAKQRGQERLEKLDNEELKKTALWRILHSHYK